VIFLRRLVAGGTSHSYGIQVARLAGLPIGVIERAREVLANLESGELDEVGRPRIAGSHEAVAPAPAHAQFQLFGHREQSEVEKRLSEISIEKMTPIEALNLLHELKGKT
jgi:DNA mismatch repair protein MutS